MSDLREIEWGETLLWKPLGNHDFQYLRLKAMNVEVLLIQVYSQAFIGEISENPFYTSEFLFVAGTQISANPILVNETFEEMSATNLPGIYPL